MKTKAIIFFLVLTFYGVDLAGQCVSVGADQTICQGGTTSLLGGAFQNGTTAATWTSSDGGTFSPDANSLTATWAPPAGFTGTATITLTATAGCSSSPADASLQVTVRPAPAAGIGGTATVCQNAASPDITFTNSSSLPVTVTYNINGGGDLNINIDASGSATVSAPTTIAGTFVYNLVSVVYQSAPTCTNSLSGSATVTVTPTVGSPSVPVPSASSICQGSSNTTYTTSATEATSYSWSVTGAGNNISGTGAAGTVTWDPAFTGTATVSVFANGCGGPSSSSSTSVNVRETPTATISGTTTVCRNSSSPDITFTNPQTSAVTITYNINGGTSANINVGAGTSATVAAPTSAAGTFNYNLVSVVYQTAPACSNALSGTASVTVNPLPVPTITGPSPVCITSTGNIYTTEAGMTNYDWTVSSGGTISAGGTSADNTVTVTWTNSGARTVRVNYTNGNGCTGSSQSTFNVNVVDKPLPSNVQINGVIREYATLTVSYDYNKGVCFDEDLSLTEISWYKANNSGGSGSSFITTKTGLDKTLVLSHSELNKYIQVRVKLSDGTTLMGSVSNGSWVGPVAANDAPVPGVLSVTGVLLVNNTLTADYNYSDTENDIEGLTAFEWWRADNAAGTSNPQKITGATSQTYILTTGDRNKYVGFKITPKAQTGTITGIKVTSPFAGPVSDNAPVASVLYIDGTPNVGSVLTGHYQYSDPEGDIEGSSVYQWYRGTSSTGTGSVAIVSATSIAYLLTNDDIGNYIGFSVIPAAQDGISPGSMATTATWTGPVTNDPPVATIQPVTGSLNVNGVITGHYIYSDAEGDTEGTSIYKWYSSSSATGTFSLIAGETGIAHIITSAEQGRFFKFEVTPASSSGSTPGITVLSAAYGPANTKPYADNVNITGIPSMGTTLAGSYDFHDVDPADLQGTSTFRWLRNGNPVTGATGLNYLLTGDDEGFNLVFEVTPVSSTGYPNTGTPVLSSATANVTDPSSLKPAAIEVCIEGIREAGNKLRGKYTYSFYKSEGVSLYQWYRNGVAIGGATGIEYTLKQAEDLNTNADITFGVTPVSSNIPAKTGTEVISNPLARILLPKAEFSVSEKDVVLTSNAVGGVFSGPGVSGSTFSPKNAGSAGSPHTLGYILNIVNTNYTCSQQSSSTVVVNPNVALFNGFNPVYCWDNGPDIISVTGVPSGATDLKFTISNSAGLISQSATSATIDPGMMDAGSNIDSLHFSYNYNGSFYKISESFVIDKVDQATITNLKQNQSLCNKDAPFELDPLPKGGVFSGPVVNGTLLDPSRLNPTGNTYVDYSYTNSSTGCSSSVHVPIVINPTPVLSFKVADNCIENDKDITQFINESASQDSVSRWEWIFTEPNGSPGVSYSRAPAYPFKTGGLVNANLTATTVNNCTATLNKTIELGSKPAANFYWRDDCLDSNGGYLTIRDTTSGTSAITSREWTIFNTPVNKDTTEIKYLKTTEGYVPVKLVVKTNYKNCDAEIIKNIYIRKNISLATDDYFENFESGNKGGWEKYDETTPIWSFGTPDRPVINDASSPSNAWYTSYSLTGQKKDSASVISPCFDFSASQRPMFRMQLRTRFVKDRDGAVLQYKVGDRMKWVTVGTLNDGIDWYNSPSIRFPEGNQIGWTTDNAADTLWKQVAHTLTELAGKKDVKFRIKYGTDGTSSDNDGIAFDDIYIGERTRRVLLEHYTNAGSTSSNNATAYLNNVIHGRDKDVVNIQYHTNFPGNDNFYKLNPGDVSARTFSCSISSVPISLIDGGFSKTNFASLSDYKSAPLDSTDLSKRSLMDARFKISVEGTEETGVLKVKSSVTSNDAYSSDNLVLFLAVTEKENSVVESGKTFLNIFRKFIPDAAGIKLKKSWIKGEKVDIPDQSWAIPNNLGKSEIEVIAFIQNSQTKEVYQVNSVLLTTAKSGINITDPNSIEAASEDLSKETATTFGLYPNPAGQRLTIEFNSRLADDAELRIYDLQGAVKSTYKVASGESQLSIENLGLKAGIYFVRVISGVTDLGFKKLIVSGE